MKGTRSDLSNTECGIARALQVVGDWWSLLIIRDAINGKQRFSEIQKSLGLAKNILSSRLKKLVDDGIFRVENEGSNLSRRYVLTEKGKQLEVVLVALWQWAEANCHDAGTLPYTLADRSSGKVIEKLEVRTVDGKKITSRGFALAPLPLPLEPSVAAR